MSYEDALEYLQGLHRFGIKLGNERFEALLDRLGNPHRAGYGIAHVAGTKGKGSTTAMIASILEAHGFRVGGYYSPYVYDVRERVQVNGEMIAREDFSRLVSLIRPHADEVEAAGFGAVTEFEMKTAIGFCYFREREVDFAAIEVGLGGRLDATNVVGSPHLKATVITNIGLDHTQILGDTCALIAAEKAGIIKTGVPIVTAAADPDALEVIVRIARERQAPLWLAREADDERTTAYGRRLAAERRIDAPFSAQDIEVEKKEVLWTDRGERFDILAPSRTYVDLLSGLRGEYQRANAACAVAAVEMLADANGFTVREDVVREGLAHVRLPGRFEMLQDKPLVILDGAHNAMATRALASEVRKLTYDRLILVVGMLQGHEPMGVLEPFADSELRVCRLIATAPTWKRRQPPEAIEAAAREIWQTLPIEIVTPPERALQAALSAAGPADAVLVTGSFYTVGDLRPTQSQCKTQLGPIET